MITLIIAFMFSHMSLLQSTTIPFFRSQIPANTSPWGTTCTGGTATNANCSIMNFPSMITMNMGWFFPLITMVLLIMTDYILAIRKGADTKTNLFAVALTYAILGYIEVAGNLATIGYFFIFELILIAIIMIMVLFQNQQG